MSYKKQTSFSAGELDPALHERTTLDKFHSGLKTLRNANIGKTGRIISRPGTIYVSQTAGTSEFTSTFTRSGNACVSNLHPIYTGTPLRFTNSGGGLPAPLVVNTTYYAIYYNRNQFMLATSLANAIAGTNITLTTAGTGTHTWVTYGLAGRAAVLYHPPYSNYLCEFGHLHVKIHNLSAGTSVVSGTEYSDTDLPYLQFEQTGDWVYIFGVADETTFKQMNKMYLGTLSSSHPYRSRFQRNNWSDEFTFEKDLRFYHSFGPTPVSNTYSISGTPFEIEYAITYVINGEESAPTYIYSSTFTATIKFPGTIGDYNEITVDADYYFRNNNAIAPTEIKMYRRPKDGAAYGFIGSSIVSPTDTGSAWRMSVRDSGQDADYSHQPPSYIAPTIFGSSTNQNPVDFPIAGLVYQQRLLVGGSSANKESIVASRTGFQNNFFREYPLTPDSALLFKCGTSGNAQVLRLFDYEGLIAFTTRGIYKNKGALTPENLAMDKIAAHVIDPRVPPLEVPGALLFVDKTTNTIRTLIYSTEANGYPGEEISIFSNHLFVNKRVVSWAFLEGDIPLIYCVMDDGTLNCLTYIREHQMQAWSHHDTQDGLFESVAVVKSTTGDSTVYVVVNRGGVRTIEKFAPRNFDDLKDFIGVDACVNFKSEIALSASATLVATATGTPGDWFDILTLTSSVPIFANTAGNGAVGTVFRFFGEDRSVDLTVTGFTSTSVVTVQPSVEFPSAEASGMNLYKTYTSLTGLTHLEGKNVSILADGYVVASPNNDHDGDIYPVVTVTAGVAALPTGERGAIIHVGLPITCDVQTLEIDTVEEKPILMESKLVGKVHVKVLNSRGLYVGQSLADNNSVAEMSDPEERTVNVGDGLISNEPQELQNQRYEVVIRNDWGSNGSFAIRQVDPLPFEILSFIPDLQVETL